MLHYAIARCVSSWTGRPERCANERYEDRIWKQRFRRFHPWSTRVPDSAVRLRKPRYETGRERCPHVLVRVRVTGRYALLPYWSAAAWSWRSPGGFRVSARPRFAASGSPGALLRWPLAAARRLFWRGEFGLLHDTGPACRLRRFVGQRFCLAEHRSRFVARRHDDASSFTTLRRQWLESLQLVLRGRRLSIWPVLQWSGGYVAASPLHSASARPSPVCDSATDRPGPRTGIQRRRGASVGRAAGRCHRLRRKTRRNADVG